MIFLTLYVLGAISTFFATVMCDRDFEQEEKWVTVFLWFMVIPAHYIKKRIE